METDPPELDPGVDPALGATHLNPPSSAEGAKTATGDGWYQQGDVIADKYRLDRLLGEGGMGAVWLAHNRTLDVDVAVKLVRREIATPEASARLLQEARASARLDHPSIVRVFDFGETERRDPFIVMEFLAGESLGQVLATQARLPAVSAVRTLLPVASALMLAHGQGIVHRDLKPDNVVLVASSNGIVTPKLVDFGIAKLRGEGVKGEVTMAGAVMGSPDYMSPEQARGEVDVDARTDVWAFAVMLYEMVTGVRPFTGVNYNALLAAIQRNEPEPLAAHGAGDAELWAIVRRGMAKEPGERWQTIRDFGVELALWCVERDALTDITEGSLEAHWLSAGTDPPSIPGLGERISRNSLAHISSSNRRRVEVVTIEGSPAAPAVSPVVSHAASTGPTTASPLPVPPEPPAPAPRVARAGLVRGALAGVVVLGALAIAQRRPAVVPGGAPAASLSAPASAAPPPVALSAAVAPSASVVSLDSASPPAPAASHPPPAALPPGRPPHRPPPRPTPSAVPGRAPRSVVPDDPNF